MKTEKNDDSSTNLSPVTSVGNKIFEYLGRTFPVASSSDEFIYFPQVQLSKPEWNTWDNFSTDSIEETVRRLSSWEGELDVLSLNESDSASQIDTALLKKMMRSLREQLSDVRTWESQPTFHLTLACIGLAEALESENPAAKHERAISLSNFLDQARLNLANVPILFRDIGLEMVEDTRNYLVMLAKSLPELQSALTALDRFEEVLKRVPTRDDFLLPKDLLERIIRFHLHCDMDIEDIDHALDREIEDAQTMLVKEAENLVAKQSGVPHPERIWLEALRNVPVLNANIQEPVRLFQEEIERQAYHCIAQGLVSSRIVSTCPVTVLPMPSFLSAIRVGASYSISPQHPPTGGKFYVATRYTNEESRRSSLREYRMTCSHETYPGHHLLDCPRWSLKQPLRRNIEYPTFYEGWACFAEELMNVTGYFSEPVDRLLLARRRLAHAIRGKVDIGLQTGAMDFATAAQYLEETGISHERAEILVRKYPLNPGYQVCYTIGLRRFRDLLHRYGGMGLPVFVQTVLNQGEILFTDLEKILQNYR